MSDPEFEWIDGDRPQLMLRGDWAVATIGGIDGQLRKFAETHSDKGLATVNVEALTKLDTAGAFIIDRTLRALSESDPGLTGANDEVADLLAQAREIATREEHAPPVDEPGHGFVDMLERTGRGAEHMWDEAKQSGKPVWQLANLPKPKALPTTMTLSLAAPEEMAAAAKATPAKILKLKLGGPDDLVRVEAVHRARPDAKLILDGNEGVSPADFPSLVRKASELGVILIEQPFPAGDDLALLKRPGRVAICADESVHTRNDLQRLSRKYDAVNIKLDKAGGLTEALAMMAEAKRCGLSTMVGCMVAGSLSMAPALILGQAADVIDLDGPLWLAEDVPHGLKYNNGKVSSPTKALWG